jgi:hypothetical protein
MFIDCNGKVDADEGIFEDPTEAYNDFDAKEAGARKSTCVADGSKDTQRLAPFPPLISTPAATASLIYCLNFLTPALS